MIIYIYIYIYIPRSASRPCPSGTPPARGPRSRAENSSHYQLRVDVATFGNILHTFPHENPLGLKIPPTTSYSSVAKQAVTRGLLTKWVIPTLFLRGRSGSGPFAVAALWLPAHGPLPGLTATPAERQVVQIIRSSGKSA